MSRLSRILLRGYKSIQECDLELKDLNVLIGPNGVGKSNFIGFFRLIQQLLEGRLQSYVSKQGGPDALLYFGRKRTSKISAELYFGNNGYKFELEPTQDNQLMFASESLWWNVTGDRFVASGHFESKAELDSSNIKQYTIPAMKSWRLYHFHDTGETALVKTPHGINDNAYLRTDGSNLAAFLFHLMSRYPEVYKRIVLLVQMIAPFFGDFFLRPQPNSPDYIELEWTEKGEDKPFKAHQLSDGTLRFICLATVLNQPENLMPDTILIDEPELGLHPRAIGILASMLRSASTQKQIIVSTQSVTLINNFSIDDLIVVDRKDRATVFRRHNEQDFQEWLDEYTVGELWEKNLLGGRG